jgi:4-amino-4-deoxy-L-arabinose transferase-like glycosyltransferase
MPSDAASEPEATAEDGAAALVPRGNALRPKRLLAALGVLTVPFLVMAASGHSTLSVPVGALGCAAGAWLLLDFLGTFDDEAAGPSVELRALLPRLAELAGGVALFVAVLRLVVAGRLPASLPTGALLVTGSLLWAGVATTRVLRRFGFMSETPLGRRWGAWLMLAGVLLYVPLLGSYSLSDPWETHYGEVAREMLARDDWLSPWWAQENWFWSKPVLDFWLQALSFSVTGVRFEPDQLLAGAGQGLVPRPEWAARLPIVGMTLIAVYLLYRAARSRFGARAGFLGGLVLLTVPYWFVLARQSMTDMPYVAPLTAALALVLLGLGRDPEERAPVVGLRVGRRVLGVSAFHLLFVLVTGTALAQILYLLSRHVTLELAGTERGFRLHQDMMLYGSPGNCGLPGNEDCRTALPYDTSAQPGVVAAVALVVLALFLWVNRGERRLQRLLFLGAWYAVALSALAKGAPGLVLPLVIGIGAAITSGRVRDLSRAELVGFLLVFLCVCLPWYAAMVGRHGPPFTDRLLFHDMYKRAFVHVHDTNTGDDVSFRYYVWQLGYGLFPWVGCAAAGLFAFQRDGTESKGGRAEGLGFLSLWLIVAFSLFSSSLTKFHHYALPAVPPLAMLTGVALDRLLPQVTPSGRRLALYLGAIGLVGLLLPYGVLRLVGGSLLGQVPKAEPAYAVGGLALVAALGLLVVAHRWWPASAEEESAGSERRYEWAFSAALATAGAMLVMLVGRDLFAVDDPDGPARLTQLASYNYKRLWPASLDFTSPLLALAIAAAVATLVPAFRAFRQHAVPLMVSVGVWSAVWAIDVYVVKVAPHWGQRETIFEYYRRRRGPEEPLAAYQMNWKGENFYTGNHVPAFVASGAKFKSYISEQRDQGTRVIYFTTEHSRESSLKMDLGKITRFERLTTKALNNKFFLARVEL